MTELNSALIWKHNVEMVSLLVDTFAMYTYCYPCVKQAEAPTRLSSLSSLVSSAFVGLQSLPH